MVQKHVSLRKTAGGSYREVKKMAPSSTSKVNVLWVAESNWTANSGIKAHSHDYYHMFMVRQGPMRFLLDDETFELNNGEALLAQPGITHGITNSSGHVAKIYEIKFTVQSPTLKMMLKGLPPTLPPSPLAEELVRELVAESGLQETASPAIASSYLLSLINYYVRHYAVREADSTSVIDTTGFSPVSVAIVHYLESNFAREVSLQEIADAVGFNKNYICSVFKRDAGMTIGNCQTAIRIRKAAEMISFSDMSLSQVASATGFVNLSHFNRIFKKVVGIPPGQYRRMFTADMLVGAADETALAEVAAENGFIVSVLGRKRLSINEILNFSLSSDQDDSKD